MKFLGVFYLVFSIALYAFPQEIIEITEEADDDDYFSENVDRYEIEESDLMNLDFLEQIFDEAESLAEVIHKIDSVILNTNDYQLKLTLIHEKISFIKNIDPSNSAEIVVCIHQAIDLIKNQAEHLELDDMFSFTEYYNILGIHYNAMNMVDSAIFYYNLSVKEDHNHCLSPINLTSLLVKTEQYDKALEVLKNYKCTDTFSFFYYWMAKTKYHLNENSEAHEWITKFMKSEIADKYFQGHLLYGDILRSLQKHSSEYCKQYNLAIEIFESINTQDYNIQEKDIEEFKKTLSEIPKECLK